MAGNLVDNQKVYGTSSEALIQKYGGVASAASHLVALVRSGELSFPYRVYFGPPSDELWQILVTTPATTSTQDYEMLSYYPKYESYLPPRMNGEPFSISDSPGKVSFLTDYYIENIRLKARRYDQNLSVSDVWSKTSNIEADELLTKTWIQALQSPVLSLQVTREASSMTVAETKTFSLMWVKGLVEKLLPDYKGKKYLDISAGWGDRLLAAQALDMDYLGFDPNEELKHGHSQMIHDYGDPKRHKVVYEGFETAVLEPESFDFVGSSPPFFTLEVYSEGSGQSIQQYSEQASWMVHFLFKSLKIAWDALKIGGVLALHLGDAPSIRSAEPANFFIETLPGASWIGALGVYSRSGRRPTWCWRKEVPGAPVNRWSSATGKTPSHKLAYTYPEYATELVSSRLASPETAITLNRCAGFEGVNPLLVYSVNQSSWGEWSEVMRRALSRKIVDQGKAVTEGRNLAALTSDPSLFSHVVFYQLLLELQTTENVSKFVKLTVMNTPNYNERVSNWKLLQSRYPGGSLNPLLITVSAETKGWNIVTQALSDMY